MTIPTDLVYLDDNLLDWLSTEEVNQLLSIEWYETKGLIFVSESQASFIVEGFDFYSPEDLGIKPDEWAEIDHCLKRWNEVDGFYHA